MKTKEELNMIKKEYETISNKLAELTEDELKEVTGGLDIKLENEIIQHGKNGRPIIVPFD